MRRLILSLVLAAAACSAQTNMLSSLGGITTRDDGSYYAGGKVLIGASNLKVTAVGRYCIAGNSNTHLVGILSASGSTVITSATVNMSGCTGGTWVFASVSPVTLSAGTDYIVFSYETGNDYWIDNETVFYFNPGVSWVSWAYCLTETGTYTTGGTTGGNTMYTGAQFQYTIVAAGPLGQSFDF